MVGKWCIRYFTHYTSLIIVISYCSVLIPYFPSTVKMELSSRKIHIRIPVKENVSNPPFHTDDDTLLFADIEKLAGLTLNHNDPTECFVIFFTDGHITEVLKLTGTTEREPYGLGIIIFDKLSLPPY